MDISAVVLNKLLTEKNLDVWAKLKLAFLDPAYASIYSAVNRYYTKYSDIPSFDDLEVVLREGPSLKTLATLRLADDVDTPAEVALDALIDQYTQNEAVRLLDKFVDKLPIYDSAEIKENLASIVLSLEDKTLTTEGVYAMNNIAVFKRPEDLARTRVHLGINNTFDSVLAGVSRQELILIGGRRGAGKSNVCSNLQVNQYEAGFTSVYFSIEMIAHETLTRDMSILANVNHQNLKNNTLTDEELLRVVKARAGMFTDSEDVVKQFLKDRDKYKFEENLMKYCTLKPDNQMVIIDDRELTLTSIDLHLGKLKSKFGDKFTLAVVDYLNQIKIESGNQYDWQPQIEVSKALKNLARKHDIVMVSPYQIDENEQARFAKGILDAADISLIMNANTKEDSAISFATNKIRGAAELFFTSPIDWDTLRISPQNIDKPAAKQAKKQGGKQNKIATAKTNEDATDLPWNE